MKKRTDELERCQCNFCRTYDRYVWAVVAECGCGCHKEDDGRPVGHDSMCCEFVNGKKKDNPYDDLRPAKDYKEILDIMESMDNLYMPKAPDKGKADLDKMDAKVRGLIKEYGI